MVMHVNHENRSFRDLQNPKILTKNADSNLRDIFFVPNQRISHYVPADFGWHATRR